GVDVEGRVAVGQAFAHAAQGANRRAAANRVVEVATLRRLVLGTQADDPEQHGAGDERAGGLDLFPSVLVGDHLGHADDVQAVSEGLAREIGVDQGGGDPDLGEAEPGGDVFNAVGHHQADDVIAAQVPPSRPVGV